MASVVGEDDHELRTHGLCVVRLNRDSAEHILVINACYKHLMEHLDRMLALPGPMTAVPQNRHFMPFSTTVGFKGPHSPPEHRRDFLLPIFGTPVEAMMRAVLGSAPPGAGAILQDCVGQDAELREVTAIVSDPGCTAQELHGDNEWAEDEPLVATMFVALQDIADEAMGPTYFCMDTHHPRCFPEGQWVAPSSREGRTLVAGGSKPATWFPLRAGDATLMHSTCWHKGGANQSDQRRTLLALSLVESRAAVTKDDPTTLRLRDFQ
ncbi:unnamed protein product [Symbiodinium sp. CCMP2592]|nr:unnamed protein product [Symbiodinium sp. CCMP2592]